MDIVIDTKQREMAVGDLVVLFDETFDISYKCFVGNIVIDHRDQFFLITTSGVTIKGHNDSIEDLIEEAKKVYSVFHYSQEDYDLVLARK